MNRYLAISPIDGRNYSKINNLSDYFSEYALNKKRIEIELKYLIFLQQIKIIKDSNLLTSKNIFSTILDKFDFKEMNRLKSIEREINHDVKSIEYYLKKNYWTYI